MDPATGFNLMHTREKIGTMGKRILRYVLDRRSETLHLKQLGASFGGDVKKTVDIVFILEGIGLLTRISKNRFIFTGFPGMAFKLNEHILYKAEGRTEFKEDTVFFNEECRLDQGKPFSIKSSILWGRFAADILYSAALDTGRMLSRNEIEQISDFYSPGMKDATAKTLVNDTINLLFALNLLEKDESNQSVSWSGPDCINVLNLTSANIGTIPNLRETLHTRVKDAEAREKSFFAFLLQDADEQGGKRQKYFIINSTHRNAPGPGIPRLLSDSKEDKPKPSETAPPENAPENPFTVQPLHVSNFQSGGFALLKGKNWHYVVTKFDVIIGRGAASIDYFKRKGIKWDVDVDLGTNRKVSKQHALIIYNFALQRWEIKCLSNKYPIRVDSRLQSFRDRPVHLTSRTSITVGGETFYFYLPKEGKDEMKEEEKQDEDKQEEERGDDERGDEDRGDEEDEEKQEENEKMEEENEGSDMDAKSN
eukprot:TRINITY_DN2541_c0_g2_i1.p1 TRINITY_DN2541_c0_g2~~TRINITY_DN2541_c0_g2_i1.p1  ORF type:complete len:480 (+),score=108.26 TRINITY_DN2541_c0_g2_i1:81-1520(+)